MNTFLSLACMAVLSSAAAPDSNAQPAPIVPTQPLVSGTLTSAEAAARPPVTDQAALSPAPTAPATVPSVTVSGTRANDTDLRRMSTASKLIFGREELDRNGDSSVGEILKRLPGVTIGGRPGRGGQVSMRGLGNGYTQILVNGERASVGFSLETLSPDQVERIEVIRGPVAEHSTQAIAGTINIVLREGYRQKDIQLRLTDNVEQGRHSQNVSLTLPGKIGGVTWLLNGSLFRNLQGDQSMTRNLDQNVAGDVFKDQLLMDTSTRTARGVHLSPRLSYRWDNGDTLNFQPFLMNVRSTGSSDSRLVQNAQVAQPAAEYAHEVGATTSAVTFLRGFGNWLHKMDAGAKFDMKFGFGRGHSDSESVRDQFGLAGARVNHFIDTSATRDSSATVGGKYTSPLGQGHLLAAGWDAEFGRRAESRTSTDNGTDQIVGAGANQTADTRRLAAFVQDEWDINARWSVYLGLRWEGIRTVSDSAVGTRVNNRSSVWSPVLHGVWRIPGFQKDQIRASLTQSYRAPPLADLIAAPTLSRLNSATRPDRTGNPSLKPELAQGIDFAYEHYLGKSGILSANGFVRDINNLMRRETTLQNGITGPRWVSTPINIGRARTSGVELEAKFQLIEFQPDAPNIDFRANYSHFWSNVDGIPGPNNRLDQQAKQTANVGLDYRIKGVPLTLGGGFNWTPAIVVQTTPTQEVFSGAKRQLDVYGLWKFSAATQLRVSANNLLGQDYTSGSVLSTGALAQSAEAIARTYTSWSVKLEMKL